MNASFRRIRGLFICAVTSLLILAVNSGCHAFHNIGTGTHMDAPQAQTPPKNGTKARDIIVEVTTDVSGAVVNVTFKRSSGSDIVDSRVADTIHGQWPRVPSTITVAELTFSMEQGFSQPKTLSSRPAP